MENREVARICAIPRSCWKSMAPSSAATAAMKRWPSCFTAFPSALRTSPRTTKKLKELPGVGDSMAEHIREILDTGDYSLRQKLLKKYPTTLLDLLQLQSLGPKKVAFLWSHFKVATVEGVEKLAQEGKLRDLPGFGEKSEQNILKAAGQFKNLSGSGRVRLNVADDEAEKLVAYISKSGEAVESVTPAGSLRRGRETVGDLDLLVTMRPGHDEQKNVDAVAAHILQISGNRPGAGARRKQVSFLLGSGLQVDVRLLEKKSFGAALMYFTVPKAHNVELRGRALQMGWTLNEYALTTLKGGSRRPQDGTGDLLETESCPYIEPELREMTGEIEAAEQVKLPKLVTLRRHSRRRADAHHRLGRPQLDRRNGQAARDLGYDYIALTDHSKAVTVANGLEKNEHRSDQENPRHEGAGDPLASRQRSGYQEGRLARFWKITFSPSSTSSSPRCIPT